MSAFPIGARTVAVLLALGCAIYLIVIGYQAVLLIQSGEILPMLLGAGLLVLPVVGSWVVVNELRFGVKAQLLARELEKEGALPPDDLPRRPSGRVDRDVADLRFSDAKAAVDADPQNWRLWFALGLAYDDARDRRRARQAIRHAISLHPSDKPN